MDYKDYNFAGAGPGHMHGRLVPHVLRMAGPVGQRVRVLDVGCGNGYVCGKFLELGCSATGVDLSQTGIELARKTYPKGRFEIMGADNNLLRNLDEKPFDIIVSTEVVEHLYSPREYARGCFEALKP